MAHDLTLSFDTSFSALHRRIKTVSKKNKDKQQDPYYRHNAKKWRTYVRFVSASFIGIMLILWGCYHIPEKDQDQFWNVFILGSVTWMILTTAWVQISINKRQWQIMRKQGRLMRKGLKQNRELFDLVERPALGVEGVELRKSPDGTGQMVIRIRNTGKSPAIKLKTLVTVNFHPIATMTLDACPQPTATPPQGLVSGGVVAVGAYVDSFADISIGGIAVLDAKQAFVTVWLRCSYWSIYGQECGLEYFARFTESTGTEVCGEEHNRAT